MKQHNLFNISTVERAITASTDQTQGLAVLTHEINEIATCANTNDSVTLCPCAAGLKMIVANNGAEVLQVFPSSGDNFVGSATNASTTINAGYAKQFISYDETSWIVFGN